MVITIGEWVESEARDITHCPSSYAADTETLRTRPGRYALNVSVEGGFMIPMPQWVLVRIDADRVDGRTYSGFGGVNFASSELPKEPAPYHVQAYAYQLGDMVANGRAVLNPEYAELATDYLAWAKKQTWEGLAQIPRVAGYNA